MTSFLLRFFGRNGNYLPPSLLAATPPFPTKPSPQQINEYRCTHCNLHLTSRSIGQTCPECGKGTIEKCTHYSEAK